MLRLDKLMVDYFARVIISDGDAELVLQSVDETSDGFARAIAAKIKEIHHERSEM